MLIKKVVSGFFFLWILPVLTQAHDYPIYPVKVTLKVETHRIRVEIKTNIIYWREKILGKFCALPGNWPEDIVQKAKAYIDSHFRIFLDGQLLKGEIIDYRCIETPLIGHKGSKLFFRIKYPLLSTGHTLTVRSGFFSEYHEHIRNGCSHHAHGFHQEFATHIKISGKVKQKVILPLQSPEHSFYFPDVLVTERQIKSESLKLGLSHLTKEFSLVLLLVLAVILYFPRRHIPRIEIVIFFLKLTAGFLFGMYFPLLLSDKLLSLWRLIGLIILSAIVYFQLADFWWFSALFISIPAWGIAAAKKMYDFAPLPEYFLSVNIFFFIGWFLTIVISLFIICMLLVVDEKYVFHRSKSMADRLFLQHRKFVVVLVGIVSTYFLFQGVKDFL